NHQFFSSDSKKIINVNGNKIFHNVRGFVRMVIKTQNFSDEFNNNSAKSVHFEIIITEMSYCIFGVCQPDQENEMLGSYLLGNVFFLLLSFPSSFFSFFFLFLLS